MQPDFSLSVRPDYFTNQLWRSSKYDAEGVPVSPIHMSLSISNGSIARHVNVLGNEVAAIMGRGTAVHFTLSYQNGEAVITGLKDLRHFFTRYDKDNTNKYNLPLIVNIDYIDDDDRYVRQIFITDETHGGLKYIRSGYPLCIDV